MTNLKVLMTALCLVIAPQLVMAGDGPPNIMLIITDQHTGSIMTQRDYPYVETPGIDKIADAGVTFTRAYTTYPVCTAYRQSLMTGMMSSKVEEDPTQFPSIGKTMAEAGYQTVYHGKWHVGNTRIRRVADWHGFETYDGNSNDTSTRERAIAFIRQDHEKPFFLVTSFMNPHDTCELARLMSGIEDDWKDEPVVWDVPLEKTPPLPANFAIMEDEPEGWSVRRGSEPGSSMFRKHPTKYWTEKDWRQYMYGYDRLLEMVDAHIEQMIDELEAQGLLDDTVIIYTSDHGDGHAAHQWNQKMTFYEEAVNVPFIISWKGKTRAGVIDTETLSSTGLDIYPTILKFAGVPIPESLHGLDMTPQVLADAGGKTIPERSYVVSEINQLGGNYKGRMVASADFKYILFDNGANREVLFDLVNDPGELQPVTYDPAYREQLLAHRNMLLDWHAKIGDDDFSPEDRFPELP
jgi:arylsulfatase A-like enzyme